MNYNKNFFCLVLFTCTQVMCFGKVVNINSVGDFDTFISKDDTLSVVKFYATWCEYSKNIEVPYRELAQLYEENSSIQFGEVDVDNLVATRKLHGVDRTPYFLLFKSGVMVDKTTSFNQLKQRVALLTKQRVASIKKSNMFSSITNALMKPIRMCKSFFR